MAYDGDGIQILSGGRERAVTEGSSSLAPELDEDSLWQMNLRGNEAMESGPYPERPGEPDCAYYIRTGLCRFGVTCRFNHPPNRKLAVAATRIKGGYPERIGQTECQYYLKTGACKFGSTCKFHHPRDKAGIVGRVQINTLGYPLRPNAEECAYYLRTGKCKFENTCKFHHPQPSNAMISLPGSPVYPTIHSPTIPGQQSYPGGLTNWPLSRASFISSPRWQGPSSYPQLILPQGLVQVPSWSAYTGQLGSFSSSESPQQTTGTGQSFGSSRQSETTNAGAQGMFSSYRADSIPMGLYALQKENIFPERPGEPECQFYMKTGDCKFGAVCRFHHPRERLIPIPNCILSPLGLPLRPNEKCAYYLRTGQCKFGNTCKFHQPQPSNAMISLPGSPVYPTIHSPTTPGQQSYPGGLTNWPLSRVSFIPCPRWQGPLSFVQLILPQGLVQVPSWSAYTVQLGSSSSIESLQQISGTCQSFGTSWQSETTNAGAQGMFSSHHAGSIPMGLYTLQQENIFPESPREPECQFT